MANNKLTPAQEKAIYSEGKNLLVSASAGSGKTFVMIERVIRLIVEGKAEVGEILAVTYTNLAAEEMKQKLIRAVVKKINEGKDAERFKRTLEDIPTAAISTFHSFCANLLRSSFYAAGVDPTFSVADEVRTKELKKRAIDGLFNKKYEERDPEFLYLSEIMRDKRSDESFKSTVLTLWEFASSEADPEEYLSSHANDITEENFYKTLGSLADIYKIKIGSYGKGFSLLKDEAEGLGKSKYIEFLAGLADTSQEIAKADLTFAAEKAKSLLESIRVPTEKNLSDEEKDLNERIKSTVGDFKKELKALMEIAADEQGQLALFTSTERATRAICLLTREFDECYSLIKREENLCDFSDLEHLVYKMLLSHPEIREELKSNYKYVFADEYQDVNGVQEKILSLISDGNLFMVGDVKQSIYAFRGCNPDIFAAKRERYNDGGEGETVNLDRNFRSGDGILKAVNNVFGRAITKEFGGVDYSAEYMTGGGLYPEGYGEATLHIIKKAKKEKRVYTGLYNPLKDLIASEEEDEEFLEGALTAQIIESEIGKEIIDPKSGEKREIKAGDIAVIVRSDAGYIHKTLKQLARRGIPATSEAEVNILDYPEVKIIIAALKLIAYYADDVPLASTLKSAIGGITEGGLAEIRRPYAYKSDKSFASCVADYEKEGEDESIREKLADFRQYLENIRLLTEFESAGEIIRRLLTERGLDLEIAAMPFGKARLERVERLIAETSPDGKNLSVNEFLERLKNSENKITLSAGAGDDCVKIMTIHASKGLEFPVVVIPRLGKQFRSDSDNVYADREEGFATDAFDLSTRTKTRTVRKKYFLLKNKMNAVKEEARIFYVAMTRAQSKLHLVSEKRVAAHAGEVSAVNATSFADFICLEDMPCVYHEESSLTPPPVKAVGEVLIGEDKPSVTCAITRNITFEYPNEKDCALPLKKSVTDLTESRKIGGAAKAIKEESEENFITAEKGVAYHKFMETRDLNATSVKSEIERLVEEKILTKEQGEILDEKSLEKAISSPLFEELKGFKIYREQPFICHFEAGELSLGGEEGKVMVQGIIDLLAIKGDSAAIVDYKTSRLSCDALKEKYGGQLSLYAAAAEKVLKVKVVKKVILNLISGESIEV